MSPAISPLAPKTFPALPQIAGVRFATAAAGIRYKDRTDVMLAVFDPGTSVAGVFTRSKCPSAPVEWCRARLKGGRARALVIIRPNRPGDGGEHVSQRAIHIVRTHADAQLDSFDARIIFAAVRLRLHRKVENYLIAAARRLLGNVR